MTEDTKAKLKECKRLVEELIKNTQLTKAELLATLIRIKHLLIGSPEEHAD